MSSFVQFGSTPLSTTRMNEREEVLEAVNQHLLKIGFVCILAMRGLSCYLSGTIIAHQYFCRWFWDMCAWISLLLM